jgi:hypothetical protein
MDDQTLQEMAKALRLSGISETLMARLDQAKASSLAYEELLLMLFQDELQSKNQRNYSAPLQT